MHRPLEPIPPRNPDWNEPMDWKAWEDYWEQCLARSCRNIATPAFNKEFMEFEEEMRMPNGNF